MARADYEGAMATAYDAGRALHRETVEAWRAALRPLRPESPYPILDLGAGTGRFSSLLAEWFDRPTVAVEPASAMRERAGAKAGDPVWVVGGAAEHLPLRDHCASLAWLSNSHHHFDDLGVAAKELRRVLRLACRVLIRGWFPDVSKDHLYWDFFPESREFAEAYPSVEEIRVAFRPVGFEVELVVRVDQVLAADLNDLLARVRLRADSTLAALSDEEFEDGLSRLEEEAASAPVAPVRESLDLIVLR